jgi:hypothetical protein
MFFLEGWRLLLKRGSPACGSRKNDIALFLYQKRVVLSSGNFSAVLLSITWSYVQICNINFVACPNLNRETTHGTAN